MHQHSEEKQIRLIKEGRYFNYKKRGIQLIIVLKKGKL